MVPAAPSAVVVCIARADGERAGLAEHDLLALVRRLHLAVVDAGAARYEGCDDFSSESRLYFSSSDTQRVAAIATQIVSSGGWGHDVHVRVSDSSHAGHRQRPPR